jgi:predicted ribosomally synthesized peptide with SipW-like signal peptide
LKSVTLSSFVLRGEGGFKNKKYNFSFMKKIIISVFTVVLVAAAVVGGTMAFFSDEEKSTSNIFTAGGLDLKVDNTSYFNGYKCENGQWNCEPWADYVVSYSPGTQKGGGAVPTERKDPTKALGPAQNTDSENFASLGFKTTLGVGGELVLGFTNRIVNGDGNDLKVVETSYGRQTCESYPEKAQVYASQYGTEWSLVGNACLDTELDLGALPWAQYVKIVDATNPNDFTDRSVDGFDVDGIMSLHCSAEPADLQGQTCAGLGWASKNLTESDKFFNYTSIKPGDNGKSIISLKSAGGDAWLCASITNQLDEEVSVVGPEQELGDTIETGELSENLQLFAWRDDGDGFYEPMSGEVAAPMSSGDTFKTVNRITFADSQGGQPLSASGATKYLGLAWCAGQQMVDNTSGALSCNGAPMDNWSQSDRFTADIVLNAAQQKNNLEFTCAGEVPSMAH